MAREFGLKLGMDSRDLERGAKRARAELRKTGRTGAAVGTQVNKGTTQASKGLGSMAAMAGKARGALAGVAAVVGSGAFLGSAVGQAREFGKAMGEVSTLLSDLEGFDRVTSQVEDLSATFGSTNVQQAGALYQTISAGASSASEALDTLDTANRLAIGGVTDVKVAVDGLTTILNAYGDQVESTTDVSDIFFTGVREGKTTVDELASSIGKVAPLAANAEIPFEELTSIIATLTGQGLSTAEAVTGIRGALTGILKPTKEARDLAGELGIEFNLAGLRAKGFGGFLQDVTEKTGGNDEALARLFGSIEGLNAVMSLTSEAGMAKFIDSMESMEERAGATETAYQKMKDTPDQELKELGATFKAVVTDIGQATSESDLFRSSVRGLTDQLKDLREWLDRDNEELSRTQFLMGKISSLIDVLGFDDLGDALGNQTTMIGRLNMSLVNSLRTLNDWSTRGMGYITDPIGAWRDYEVAVTDAIATQERARGAFSGDMLGGMFSGIIEQVGQIGPAVEQAAAQMRAMGQTELADKMMASLEAMRQMPGVLTETGQAAGEAAVQINLLSEEGLMVKEAFQGQIETLQQEIVALNQGEQAALRMKLEQQALKEEDEAARQQLLEMIDTIIEMTEERKTLEEQIKKEKEAEQSLREERSRVEQELDSMLRKIDPVIKAERELLELKILLEDAEKAGREVSEERQQLLLEEARSAVEAARATEAYESAIQRQLQTMNQGNTSFDAVQSAVNLANQAIRDGVTISQEWLDTLRELAKDHNIDVNFNTSGKPPGGEDEEGRFTSDAFISRAAGTASQIAQEEMGLTSGGIGSMVGSVIGSAWGPIGTAVGGLIGSGIDTLFGSGAGDEPTFRFASSQPSYSDLDQSRQTPFGGISTGEVYNIDQGQIESILNQVAEFDRRLTGLFDPSEYDAIAAALQNMDQTFEGSMANAQSVMEERFITALEATQPELVGFIESFGDLENMLRAFAGIEAMENQIDDLDNAILALSEDSIDQLRASLNRMDTSLEESRKAWERAQASQDPEQIAQAAQALQQQITERYKFERDLIHGIQNDLESLAESTRDFNRSIAEQIADLSGDVEGLLTIDEAELARTRQAVLGAESPGEGLERIDEFTNAVTNWLDTSVQRVEQLRDLELDRINNAISALQQQNQELESEAAEIQARAQQRQQRAQQRAQAASQAASQAAQRARKREMDALKAQLSVAEEMVDVADRARDMLESLELSTTSPASGFSRLETINRKLDEARTGGDQERVMDLLEERLNLVQSEGLMQRGSSEFLDLFNRTMEELTAIEQEARPAEDEAQALRKKIAALQEQGNQTMSSGFSQSRSTNAFLSSAEQRRLEEIKEEQKANQEEIAALEEEAQTVRQEARDEIEELKKTAIDQLEWARNEREEFADARNEELTTRLDEITGGLDSDSYLGRIQTQAEGHLRNIAGTMSELLEEWRTMNGQGSGSGGGVGDPGPGPGPIVPTIPATTGTKSEMHVTIPVTMNGPVDAKSADNFVRMLGPKFKRYMETA